MKCLTLAKIALPLISFDLTCLICPSYLSLLSKMTPRYLASNFSSIGTPLSSKLIFSVFGTFLVRKRRAFDFFTLRLSLFAINQCDTLTSSWLSVFSRSLIFLVTEKWLCHRQKGKMRVLAKSGICHLYTEETGEVPGYCLEALHV